MFNKTELLKRASSSLERNKAKPDELTFFRTFIFFSATGSRVPVVDAESPSHNRKGRKAFSGTIHVRRGSVFSFLCLAKLCCSLLNVHHMLDQDFVFAQFGP